MYVSKLLTHHLGLIKQCQSRWLQESKIVQISSILNFSLFFRLLWHNPLNFGVVAGFHDPSTFSHLFPLQMFPVEQPCSRLL